VVIPLGCQRILCIPALALSLCAAGCATQPDVVATTSQGAFGGPDGGIVSGKMFTECKPGRYEGTMNALPGDGGVAFSGTIVFSLVQTLGGEFPVLANAAHLEGTSKDMSSSFSAEIPSGLGCIEGKFNTELLNGTYTIGTAKIPFDGPIEGVYNAKFLSFAGSWTSHLHFTPENERIVHGIWTANYAGPN
jgi:hypothetical protein